MQLTRKEIIKKMSSQIAIAHIKAGEYADLAKAALSYLEKAGVLMLVDDEPQEGDLITYKYKSDVFSTWRFAEKNGTYHIDDKIIQRNNTPVYQCKTEKEDAK